MNLSTEPPGDSSEQVIKIAHQIKPYLAGKDPRVQSAVLAELLSLWLAGFHIPGDPEETLTLRADLLASHCILVHRLTEVNAKTLGTDQ